MNLDNLNITPIQKLSESLNNNTFYIKRDDLLPISFGGNKVRKAILFFKDLLMGNFDCVVTYGSSSSNHCRIIANMAAANGILCYIISPLESFRETYNSIFVELLGAFVTKCPVKEVNTTINRILEELKSKGFKPYFIQGGGHGVIGTEAYVQAYQEIIEFEKESNLFFDYIFHSSGTGSTQAGLICGMLLHGEKKEIVGVSCARNKTYGSRVILDSIKGYLLNSEENVLNEEIITFLDDYILDGYSYYNEQVLKTIKEVLMLDGIPMDTTYTGKAYWGMKDYIKKNRVSNKNILFIHTGGTPLFFDDLEELIHEERYKYINFELRNKK